jgi:hypothetical protein
MPSLAFPLRQARAVQPVIDIEDHRIESIVMGSYLSLWRTKELLRQSHMAASRFWVQRREAQQRKAQGSTGLELLNRGALLLDRGTFRPIAMDITAERNLNGDGVGNA